VPFSLFREYLMRGVPRRRRVPGARVSRGRRRGRLPRRNPVL